MNETSFLSFSILPGKWLPNLTVSPFRRVQIISLSPAGLPLKIWTWREVSWVRSQFSTQFITSPSFVVYHHFPLIAPQSLCIARITQVFSIKHFFSINLIFNIIVRTAVKSKVFSFDNISFSYLFQPQTLTRRKHNTIQSREWTSWIWESHHVVILGSCNNLQSSDFLIRLPIHWAICKPGSQWNSEWLINLKMNSTHVLYKLYCAASSIVFRHDDNLQQVRN